MLRVSVLQLDTWRSHYHRIRIPRQAALQRYVRRVETRRAKNATAAATAAGASPNNTNNPAPPHPHPQPQRTAATAAAPSFLTAPSGAPPASVVPGDGTVPHKYNRFFVNESWDFVSTDVVVEDPDVTAQRRATLPDPTDANLWKNPRAPFFEPFAPFLRIVDYGKDPDFKYMKPTNVPRWKDFMLRKKPVVPRTWY